MHICISVLACGIGMYVRYLSKSEEGVGFSGGGVIGGCELPYNGC